MPKQSDSPETIMSKHLERDLERLLDLAVHDDAVARVVAENEGRSEPTARCERQRDTGVRVVTFDVLAHRRLMSRRLHFGHDDVEHGAHHGVQALTAHAAVGLIPRRLVRRILLRGTLRVLLQQLLQLGFEFV